MIGEKAADMILARDRLKGTLPVFVEHRTYTFKPGTLAPWLKKYEAEGLPLQKQASRPAARLLHHRDRQPAPDGSPVGLRQPRRSRPPARRDERRPGLAEIHRRDLGDGRHRSAGEQDPQADVVLAAGSGSTMGRGRADPNVKIAIGKVDRSVKLRLSSMLGREPGGRSVAFRDVVSASVSRGRAAPAGLLVDLFASLSPASRACAAWNSHCASSQLA